MAEPQKMPTIVVTWVCRTYNENIVVKSHPLGLVQTSQENIRLVLESFCKLKIVKNDGLLSYIGRYCHHKVSGVFLALTKMPSGISARSQRRKKHHQMVHWQVPHIRRDLKKKKIFEDAPQNGPLATKSLFQCTVDHGQSFLHL